MPKGQRVLFYELQCSTAIWASLVMTTARLTSTGGVIIFQGISQLTLTMEAPQCVHTAVAAQGAVQGALVNICACHVVSGQEEPFPARTLVATLKVDTVLVTPTIRIQTLIDICQHNSDVNNSDNDGLQTQYPLGNNRAWCTLSLSRCGVPNKV